MGVLIGDAQVTRFSYIEYQALMLLLAGTICIGFIAIELALRRFQVLPLLFPGMFTIRAKKFFFFDLEVSDVAMGRKLQGHTKTLVRMTLCVVLSYLWQQCVLSTTQMVGTEFPQKQCDMGDDCFASDIHFLTFLTRQHVAVDCGQPAVFPSRVVVSCIRFVNPEATTLLMHLAIAHSVTLLNLKCFEVLVWLVGNSPKTRCLVGAMAVISLLAFMTLFFSGVVSEFVTSWLSFVMSFSVPTFLYAVYRSGQTLEVLWKKDVERVQASIEEHLNLTLKAVEPLSVVEGTAAAESSQASWVPWGVSSAASKTLNRITGSLPSMLPMRANRSSASVKAEDTTPREGQSAGGSPRPLPRSPSVPEPAAGSITV